MVGGEAGEGGKGEEKELGGVAQWVKSSLCRLENLGSDPSTHLKRDLGL